MTPEDQAEDWWCPALRHAIFDRDTLFHYAPASRAYGVIQIPTTGPLFEFDHNRKVLGEGPIVNRPYLAPGMWDVKFCPFCGIKLPGELTALAHEILVAQGVIGRYDTDPRLPDRYQSNQWWKEDRPADPGPCLPRQLNYGWKVRDCLNWEITRRDMNPLQTCLGVDEKVSDWQSGFVYIGKWRDLGIRQLDWKKPAFEQPLRYVRVNYSTDCGRRWPGSLKERWKEELASAGIPEDSPTMPYTYATDHWWTGPERPSGVSDCDAGRYRSPPEVHCTPPLDQMDPKA